MASGLKPIIYEAGDLREMVPGTDTLDATLVPSGAGGGTGDVVGPASSTDNTLPRFDGAGGKTLQTSGVVVSDANAVSGVASLDVTGNVTVGGTVDGVDVSALSSSVTSHTGAAAPHSGHEATANKGVASGYASLDVGARVSASQFVRGNRVVRREPVFAHKQHYYGDETEPTWSDNDPGSATGSGHRCGLVAIPPDDAGVTGGAVHPDEGSFPYINPDAPIDWNGYPSYNQKRYHSTNSASDNGEDGYEFGAFIPAGALRPGEGVRRTFRFRWKNAHDADASVEVSIEPNHARGTLNSSKRARIHTGPIGFTWSGWRELVVVSEFRFKSGDAWTASARFSLVQSSAGEIWSGGDEVTITSGHNFDTTDTEYLTWLIATNEYALRDSFTDYSAQGTGNLELVLVSMEQEPISSWQ